MTRVDVDAQHDDGLLEIVELARHPSIEGALHAVREFLGMDVAYATEHTVDTQIFRHVEGDPSSFGVSEEFGLPLKETYCQRILDGRLPNLIADVRADERASSLAVTEAAGVGAFASVPLRFSDGRLFGTLCAASHESKPSLGYRDLQFLHVFARIVADQLERKQLQDVAQTLELQATAAAALIAAAEARDAYTGEHSQQIVDQAGAVALKLGLSAKQITDVRQVALLHDIGKLSVPDAILNKPGPLNEDEWVQMRRHPIASEALINSLPGLQHLAKAVRAEHERWDGLGYPDGLAGEEIPLESRITLVCDAFHAMISDRPYRKALSIPVAAQQIAEGMGSQFCPRAAEALLQLVRPTAPTGSRSLERAAATDAFQRPMWIADNATAAATVRSDLPSLRLAPVTVHRSSRLEVTAVGALTVTGAVVWLLVLPLELLTYLT